jgi:hypothetical protein
MLSCARVDIRGHDRAARCGFVAILSVLGCVESMAQAPATFTDLTRELADRIAVVLPRGARVALAAADGSASEPVNRELADLLTSRGFRVAASDANPAANITVSCGKNLRERACVADVRRADARDTIAVVKQHVRPFAPAEAAADASTGTERGDAASRGWLAIEPIPIFRQRAPILDVALQGDRLLVLDPTALSLYRRSGDDWQRVASRPIAAGPVWPRDVRGRLRVADTVDAYLPGVVCRGPLELASLTCAEQREPWPLAVDNTGLGGLRNAFQTPEGAPFFSAAALDPDADARAAIVDGTGSLVLLDAARKSVATIGAADDVAGVAAACGGVYLLTSAGQPGASTDTLRVWRVSKRTAIAAATPWTVAGRVTALWAGERSPAATLVVHDAGADRYAAFQIRLACDR